MSGDYDGEERRSGNGGWRPVPDPTVLTTEQLRREIEAVRGEIKAQANLFEVQLQSAHDLADSRHKGMESVATEKFATVEQQFELVERQRVEQKLDTKVAVDAALAAQKEAVREQTLASGLAIGKSETGTTKQLEQLAANFTIAITGVQATLGDLKDRVSRLEERRLGQSEFRSETRLDDGQIIAIISAVILVAGIIVTVLLTTRK